MIKTLTQREIIHNFDAQVTAELMIKTNALIPMNLAARLCGLTSLEIEQRLLRGLFPEPRLFPCNNGTSKKSFYLNDLQEWMNNPHVYVRLDPKKLH
ncbi:MAG: hypothetical protein N0E44_19115 [Candidatus Thiodiazotropha lotti]|nr:hypothetical protein [Candidatus Thiodiazotropha lotti]MCW4221996.1 hypothetical protein [Candidatus Thiodiazotropha lotti]